MSTLRLALTLLAAALVPLLAYAAAPAWWSQRGVLVPNATAEDYAPVNQGQLKNIARAGVAEMDAQLPGGAGAALHNLVTAWASPTAQTNDFAPVNLGQLKNVAKPFYDRLIAVGLISAYPWSGSSGPPDDFAVANIGQAKNVFSFDLVNLLFDGDGNGLPDAWEQHYFGHLGVDPNADPDGDGLTNLQEFQNNTAPDDYYNGATPQLILLAGDGQTVKTDSNAPRAFELLVLKADGTPLPNAPVTFAVASGDGLLTGDATPGAPLSGSVTVRADYSGRVRPPVATVLYHASSSPGIAVVQAVAQSAVAQYSMTVTTDGPLAAPTLLSATPNPDDGTTLFQWSLPPSGIPATSSIAFLGRGTDGAWHTIATVDSLTTSYNAASGEVTLYTEFALRVYPEFNNPSPLSNVLGGSSGVPSYVVVELGNRGPLAVASDGTVVLYDGSYYRKRGEVEEVLDGSFGFTNMNDLGDIVGSKYENGAYSAYAILASNPASVLTKWARAGHGGASYLATSLRQINEKGTVTGYETMVEPAGGTLRFNSGTTFTSTVPLSLNTIASYSYTYDWSWERKTGATGNSYNFRDLDNHGRAVGRENHVVTNTETPVYYGFGTGPRPSGDSAFDPIALNDDGLVLGLSNNVARLWEPSTGFRTLALPNSVDTASPLRVTDPPVSDPDKTVFILAGNNLVFRTWKDADGQPSAFPIYTARGAADLLPPDSPYDNLYLANISNNGIIVATARKVSDESYHGIMLVPVAIVPDSGVEGKFGGMVESNLGSAGKKHFVSPPNLPDYPNYNPAEDYVTFVASGVTAEQFSRLLKWDPAFGENVPGAANKRRVKRVPGPNNILRVLTQDGDREVTKLNVWIVSTTIAPDLSTMTQPAQDDQVGLYGLTFRANLSLKHTIFPPQILTDSDRPNLLDPNGFTRPPGGKTGCINERTRREIDLGEGADQNWDVSRQFMFGITQNHSFLFHLDCTQQKYTAFPNDNIIGNDDAETTLEVDNPYTAPNKQLVDVDNPAIVGLYADGSPGDWAHSTMFFREFTRLCINKTWYRVSMFYDYHVDFNLVKVGQTSASIWTLDSSQQSLWHFQ